MPLLVHMALKHHYQTHAVSAPLTIWSDSTGLSCVGFLGVYSDIQTIYALDQKQVDVLPSKNQVLCVS